jgi:hypothetical protein
MTPGENWITFLRQFGPLARNDSSFDERIVRAAARLRTRPVEFEHPLEKDILSCVLPTVSRATSIVLTGNAGDGKSRLCRKLWAAVGGDPNAWEVDFAYFEARATVAGREVTVVFLRDLTALVEPDPQGRYESKTELLLSASRSFLQTDPDKIYVVAANDGQLIESWRRGSDDPFVEQARVLLEAHLMGDANPTPSASLSFFNLSTVPCTTVLDLVLDAVLAHEGWEACRQDASPLGFFGPSCPIRHNYELLGSTLVRSRLRELFELCQFSELHTPIRRVFMLIATAILGHPDVRDGLMRASDIRKIVESKSAHKANLYANLFGGSLTPTKRQSLEIFDYMTRFGIGYETTNRLDNILIFGAEDESLRPYFDALVAIDPFYGANDSYRAAQSEYMENPSRASDERTDFLRQLVDRRRGLFFTIPNDQANELELWRLTVFTTAGEYLEQVAGVLQSGGRVQRHIVNRLVNGLNRVFTGLLVTTNRDLLLATSLANSEARVSQLLEEKISVARRKDERIEISLEGQLPSLDVYFSDRNVVSLGLNLIRYEFLCRVADGALPGSFSRECYEDILSFKSALLSTLMNTRETDEPSEVLSFRLLTLDPLGNPVDEVVELSNA